MSADEIVDHLVGCPGLYVGGQGDVAVRCSPCYGIDRLDCFVAEGITERWQSPLAFDNKEHPNGCSHPFCNGYSVIDRSDPSSTPVGWDKNPLVFLTLPAIVTIETIYTPTAPLSCGRVCIDFQWLL